MAMPTIDSGPPPENAIITHVLHIDGPSPMRAEMTGEGVLDENDVDLYQDLLMSSGVSPAQVESLDDLVAADASGEIRGRKWHDLDGDGMLDPGEQIVPGWTIYLDLDDDRRLDPGEPTALTGAGGEYLFTGLEAGTYAVGEVPRVGWEQTFPGPIEDPASTVRIVSGLSRPVFVTAPSADTGRLFIVEQHSGRIKILDIDSGVVNSEPFLDIDGLATGNEQGLLGLAFHPDYASNGFFYVNLTATDRSTHIRRYRVSADNPDIADPQSATTILTFAQPQSNHNGGWLGFGPGGMLHVATGDGGGAHDNATGHTPGVGNSQDITDNPLGKMGRLDVNGDDFPDDPDHNYAIPAGNPFVGTTGDDQIWAYGLRNPWRASFDRLTGDLYIGDVGQGTREEINFQPASSPGGENYGWRLREGKIATPRSGVGGPRPPGAVDPIYDYGHGSGPEEGFSVTGGYVYRGPIQQLQGKYFFADFGSRQIWSIEHDGTNVTEFINHTAQFSPDVGSIGSISSFGEDAVGNLYIVDLGGEVFKVVASSRPGQHTVTILSGEVAQDIDFANRPLEPHVVDRHLFYNGSVFDGGDAGPSAMDDLAVAADKSPLLPGGTATFENYSSYHRGINGIMVDLQGLADPLQLGYVDFEFRVGNNDHPSSWIAAPEPPSSITVRQGAGVGGSDRISLTWNDHIIERQWLEVTVLSTPQIGLVKPDVFYFGSAVGETGDSATDAAVELDDERAIRENPRSLFNPAPIEDRHDINRDGLVNTLDQLTARRHQSGASEHLALISVPARIDAVGWRDGQVEVEGSGVSVEIVRGVIPGRIRSRMNELAWAVLDTVAPLGTVDFASLLVGRRRTGRGTRSLMLDGESNIWRRAIARRSGEGLGHGETFWPAAGGSGASVTIVTTLPARGEHRT